MAENSEGLHGDEEAPGIDAAPRDLLDLKVWDQIEHHKSKGLRLDLSVLCWKAFESSKQEGEGAFISQLAGRCL